LTHTKENICPLCQTLGKSFYQEIYFECPTCSSIFKNRHQLPDVISEKQRYEVHNNDINDLGYQKFVSPITNVILANFTQHHEGLDFGAGTGPVISKILLDNGYNIKQYDPFFHPHPHLLEQSYDYIACCEVIEHFFHPYKEFELLKKLLKPNGKLYCMTHIYDPSIAFDNWYYKNDPTHVFIYQKEAIQWIKQHFNFSSVTIEGRLITFSC
jgi:hypothetical protein